MTNIFRVFRYEFNRNVRRRGFLAATFGFPILMIAIGYVLTQTGMGTVSNNPQETVNQAVEALNFNYEMIAGYVDQSGLFVDGLDVDNMRRFPDEATARAAVESGEIGGAYIIPPDYAEEGNVRLIVPSLTINHISSQPIYRLIFTEMIDSVDGLVLSRLQNPANINKVNIERAPTGTEIIGEDGEASTTLRNEDSDFVVAYVFVILFLLAVFATNGYLMQSVIEEKESRLIEILISSVRPVQLLTGKILALGTLGLSQVAIWILIGYLALQTQPDMMNMIRPLLASVNIPVSSLVIMLIYFILGYLLFAAFFGAIGAISTSMQEGPQFTIILVLPAMLPLYIMPALIADPNGTLATIFSIFPITAPIGMLIRTTLTNVPLAELALSIGLLALTDLFVFWIAGRLFRVQTLLSGQTPGIRDIPKLIFGG